MGTPSADITGDTLGMSSIPSGSSDILLPTLPPHLSMSVDVLPPFSSQPDFDVSSDSGYLSSLNSLPSRHSPQCAVKEVSQEDIDMALFGFTSSVPVPLFLLLKKRSRSRTLMKHCLAPNWPF